MPVRKRKEVQKMLRKKLVIIIFLLVFISPCFGEVEYAPGEMFVKFRPDVVDVKGEVGAFSVDKAEVRSSNIKGLNAKYKVKKIKSFVKKEKKIKKLRSGRVVELPDLSQIYLLEFSQDMDVKAAVQDFQNDPSVEFASPNYRVSIFTTPNDEFYVTGESPTHDPNQWGLYKIWLKPTEEAMSGWNLCTGTSEIKVAVIDTGVNYNHVDLKTRVNSLEGYDFVNSDPDPIDDHGHGTHVAGIIGAITNNTTGCAGVDWNCRIIPIKALGADGGDFDDSVYNSLIWAVDTASVDVINMSLGGTGNDPVIAAAIAYAAASDVVLVAAAGNNYPTPPFICYPAYYDHVIAVAATNSSDRKTFYSNFGTWVEVSAPGGEPDPSYTSEILSTYCYIPGHIFSDTCYTWMSGTSMAAPFVSGLAALVRARFPSLTADEVSQRIINYSDNIDSLNPGYIGKIGKGRINALLALGGLYGYISEPRGDAFGIVEIRGTATGEMFDHYDVDWGHGRSPTSWVNIATSSTAMLNTVLATLDTTGMDEWLTVRVKVNDLDSTSARATFHAGSQTFPILSGRAEYGPNPFNPRKGQMLIMYELTRNSDTYIYFYDLTGNLVCRKFYAWGTTGGNQGVNRVYWDGVNDFGETVANGVYLFRIASEGRTIGKGKIIVLK